MSKELLRKAYLKVYGKDCDLLLADELLKLVEQYNLDNAILKFDEQPMVFMPSEKPVKKAKEIALEAAIKIVGSDAGSFTIGDKTYQPGERTLSVAENVYQWLIKKTAYDKGATENGPARMEDSAV